MLTGIVVGLLFLLGLLLLPGLLALLGVAVRGLLWGTKWGLLTVVVVFAMLWLLSPSNPLPAVFA